MSCWRKRRSGACILSWDLVINHCSDKHEWFQKALAGDETYQKYYIFKDGRPDRIPTNWQSKFGGPAWEYVPALQKNGISGYTM